MYVHPTAAPSNVALTFSFLQSLCWQLGPSGPVLSISRTATRTFVSSCLSGNNDSSRQRTSSLLVVALLALVSSVLVTAFSRCLTSSKFAELAGEVRDEYPVSTFTPTVVLGDVALT